MATIAHRERALFLAVSNGNVELARLMLRQHHADPNATDSKGRTALLLASCQRHPYMEVVRLLLETGADPTIANEEGLTPLHAVAGSGHIELVDMLFLRAPGALNRSAASWGTTLYVTCFEGNECMVFKLLSLGTMEPVPLRGRGLCPLVVAVTPGLIGVARILTKDSAMQAVEGDMAMSMGLHAAIECRQMVVFTFHLVMDGEERRSWWTKIVTNGMTPVHLGALCCYPAAVSVLLLAGADETVHNLHNLQGRVYRARRHWTLSAQDGSASE